MKDGIVQEQDIATEVFVTYFLLFNKHGNIFISFICSFNSSVQPFDIYYCRHSKELDQLIGKRVLNVFDTHLAVRIKSCSSVDFCILADNQLVML